MTEKFVYSAKLGDNMKFVYPSKEEEKANFVYTKLGDICRLNP